MASSSIHNGYDSSSSETTSKMRNGERNVRDETMQLLLELDLHSVSGLISGTNEYGKIPRLLPGIFHDNKLNCDTS